MYGPAKASPSTIVSASVRASALNTSSSTIGPAGLESTCLSVTSNGTAALNTTVVSSGVSTDSMLASSDTGPFGSSIVLMRSNENLTSEEVRSLPLANFRPSLILTVNWEPSSFQVPSSAAMSGLSSEVL